MLLREHAGGSASACGQVGSRVAPFGSPSMGMPLSRMIINGAPVDDSLVPELARAINNTKLAHKLETAHRFRTEQINLSNAERSSSRGTPRQPQDSGVACTAGRTSSVASDDANHMTLPRLDRTHLFRPGQASSR